jgi:hypothetical protein
MNSHSIANQFAQMGARFRAVSLENLSHWGRRVDYALDIARDRHGQIFELRLAGTSARQLDINVLQCERHDRHLLLLVKTPEAKDRFLCGHDEREWFVAAVPGGASSVMQAKLALQPGDAKAAADRAGLNVRQRTRRHNRAFVRQGEWFFVPAPELRVDPRTIHRDEPISRSGGKPHLVAEVYRAGGENVWMCARFPNGLTDTEYKRALATNRDAKHWGWQRRVRDAGVFARGTVRHRDHATVTLHGWHRVWMNTEHTTRQMANVAFLD